MKRFALVVVSVALFGFAGCGGDKSSGNPDEDRIREVMASFSDAISRQEYDRACSMYVQDTVEFFEAQAQIPGGCEGVMKVTYGSLSNDRLDGLGTTESVEVDGQRATVELENGDSARLRKVAGAWKLSLD